MVFNLNFVQLSIELGHSYLRFILILSIIVDFCIFDHIKTTSINSWKFSIFFVTVYLYLYLYFKKFFFYIKYVVNIFDEPWFILLHHVSITIERGLLENERQNCDRGLMFERREDPASITLNSIKPSRMVTWIQYEDVAGINTLLNSFVLYDV